MTPEEKDAFTGLLEQLCDADRATLMSFAEFLLSRGTGSPLPVPRAAPPPAAEPVIVPEPETIPRPAEEKVVAAVKRLSKTYFMLDKKQMLSVTSDLMTQHLMQGREAADVIDEMEALFQQHYETLKQGDAG